MSASRTPTNAFDTDPISKTLPSSRGLTVDARASAGEHPLRPVRLDQSGDSAVDLRIRISRTPGTESTSRQCSRPSLGSCPPEPGHGGCSCDRNGNWHQPWCQGECGNGSHRRGSGGLGYYAPNWSAPQDGPGQQRRRYRARNSERPRLPMIENKAGRIRTLYHNGADKVERCRGSCTCQGTYAGYRSGD